MAQTIEKIGWTVDGQEFEGHAVWEGNGPKPAVLVCHAWAGQGEFDHARAGQLAELGYVGIALDVYGKGKRGQSPAECEALMMPLVDDFELRVRRLQAALNAVTALAVVDKAKVTVTGFCFGGLCALDVARMGADVCGVVSFHGLLGPTRLPKKSITAKLLVLHGYDDPMVKPDAVVGFCNEMTAAGADWQLHAYGGTMHAFTNPAANDPGFGTVYHPIADARSRIAMENFLTEIFS